MPEPRRALIVVDVQNDYFAGPLSIQYPPREDSLANITRAMDEARDSGIPILTVQHIFPADAPVFAEGSEGARLHPDVARRADQVTENVTKQFASVFAADGVTDWLRERGVDTLTLVGYMTNNCILGTAAGAEPLGFAVEVLADATGAIHLANEAGSIPARQVHETLLALLHSNWAAVASTEAWTNAVASGATLPTSDLGTTAGQGAAAHGQR